jgi:hypothetical protein
LGYESGARDTYVLNIARQDIIKAIIKVDSNFIKDFNAIKIIEEEDTNLEASSTFSKFINVIIYYNKY